MTEWMVRQAKTHDEQAVRLLLKSAFGADEEANLVDRLRESDDLALSRVAVVSEVVIGYIACSRLLLNGNAAIGASLAPLAVMPEWQKRGVGAMLVTNALDVLLSKGFDFVLVLGDPDYYSRFGFSVDAAQRFITPYDGPYMQVKHITDLGREASGEVVFASAFGV